MIRGPDTVDDVLAAVRAVAPELDERCLREIATKIRSDMGGRHYYIARHVPGSRRGGGRGRGRHRVSLRGRGKGVGVFYWIDEGCGYAISGSLDRAQLLKIAHVV